MYFCPRPMPNPLPWMRWQEGHMLAHGPMWVLPSMNVPVIGWPQMSHLRGAGLSHFLCVGMAAGAIGRCR